MRNFSKEYIKFLEDHPDNPANKSKLAKVLNIELDDGAFSAWIPQDLENIPLKRRMHVRNWNTTIIAARILIRKIISMSGI